MFNNIGSGELLIIGLVIMILFGSKKLPELTKSIADASKEFKKGLSEEEESELKKPIKNKKVHSQDKEVK
jgi:sec-independent protein translocase protein TatA